MKVFGRSPKVSGIWPVKSESRRSQEKVQGASEKSHHGLKHLSWHWATSPALPDTVLLWVNVITLGFIWWAVGMDEASTKDEALSLLDAPLLWVLARAQ